MAGLVGLCGMAQAVFVTIGDAGNAADPSTGYGAVGYTYRISATEVTIAEFWASGAGNGNENYWNDGTRTVGANAPATYVSLYEAMKYCNWLTSGNVNSGTYVFNGGVYQFADRVSAVATYGTAYALPTENEWYKAAYYTGNSGDPWSLYANGTDVAPTWGTADGWNYYSGAYVLSSPNYTWTVGSGSEEQNGTHNMMGNVAEWMEFVSGDVAIIRGGAFGGVVSHLRSSTRATGWATTEVSHLGFRVVSIGAVPEPASALMIAVGGGLIAIIRRFYGRT